MFAARKRTFSPAAAGHAPSTPIARPHRLRPGRLLERHAGNDALAPALATSEVGGDCLNGRVPAFALIEPPEARAVEDLLVPAALAERLQVMPGYSFVIQCSDVPGSHAPRGTGRERFGNRRWPVSEFKKCYVDLS